MIPHILAISADLLSGPYTLVPTWFSVSYRFGLLRDILADKRYYSIADLWAGPFLPFFLGTGDFLLMERNMTIL